MFKWVAICAAAILPTSAACTLILDRGSSQCQTDGDCAHFGDHPFCQAGVCVASGLGPSDCFYGNPSQQQDFLNQCSAAACVSFDECLHGLCADAGEDAPLVAPAPIEGGASSGGASGDASGVEAGGAAMPSCLDATQGRSQLVVMTGSSNFPPLLAKLAPLIVATGYTPVYQVTNSCTGVNAVFGSGTATMITDPSPSPNAKYAAYYDASGGSHPCLVGPGGAQVDVGESDIFSTTCNPELTPSSGVGEYLGPIQAMAFVVPGKSQETAITAAAARVVFGMGGTGVVPWNDPSLYFVRNANTGTQQQVGRAIGVPANAFWGIDRGSASNVDALMKVIADPSVADQAIGIISVDYYDSDRANLRALAFQSPGQDCAYLPDSTSFLKDKQNVRDGHYPIWGPLHFFAATSGGVPVSPAAQAFVSLVSVPNIPQPLLDAFIGSSLVPACAMQVQRSSELGPLASYEPPFECECYFLASPSVNGSPPSQCAACKTANDCTDPARPACNLGYCEPH
jgi:ABC-type phosphate transport system substrate-binding protein